MFKKKIVFKNSKGLKHSAIYEGEDINSPAVLMCHGYGSSKDSKSNRSLIQKLLQKGLTIFAFDFTACGESEGILEDLTPLQGLDDLKSAVKNLDKKDFALYGSSFGGYVSLLYSSENPVLALALKAPVSDYINVKTYKSKENYGFSESKKEYFVKEIEKMDIYAKVHKIKGPTLIVHGDSDPIVPIGQSKKLIKYLSGDNKLITLAGALHVMKEEDLEKANSLIADFFKEKLL